MKRKKQIQNRIEQKRGSRKTFRRKLRPLMKAKLEAAIARQKAKIVADRQPKPPTLDLKDDIPEKTEEDI